MTRSPEPRERYGGRARRVNLALAASLLLASPAAAASVAEVLAAQRALQVPPGMDEGAWRAHRAAHEAELRRAHAVLALAHAAEEAVLATAAAALAQYGVPLICNRDEEARPGFDELAEEFVAEGARRHGLSIEAARPRLLRADVEEMLATTLLRHYRCPAPVSGSGSPPTPAPR